MNYDRAISLAAALRRRRACFGGTIVLALGLCPATAVSASDHPATNSAPAAPFLRYTNEVIEDVPLSIHIVRIQRGSPDWRFCTTLGHRDQIGMGDVSGQVKALPPECGQPIAAINGDFYEKNEKHDGRPRDLQIRLGELVTGPSGHCCFWITPDGQPHMTNIVTHFRVVWPDGKETPIGLNGLREDNTAMLYTAAYGGSTRATGGTELVLERAGPGPWLPLKPACTYAARVRETRSSGETPLNRDTMALSFGPACEIPLHARPGASVKVILETSPELSGVDVAIGGGPTLVENGKAREWNGFFKLRHPRTALGWNDESFFLVVVDGRQGDVSVGMTFSELAAYLVKLGCKEAMNLDGGGSATLWAYGMVKNSPSEGQERPAPNALVVLKKDPIND